MNEQKEVRFIDLFAGVGGFHKGLEQANNSFTQPKTRQSKEGGNRIFDKQGTQFHNRQHSTFSCVWANEWDKHAASIYKKRFPQTEFFEGDVRSVEADDIGEADLLVAGFPCQSFSLAGKRKGFEEARGTLFYEICRIARDKRIPYLLLENVKGLLSAQDHYAFAEILCCLDELGYLLQWQVLNSKDFGVPQNRERVFVVGCLGEKRFKQVFPLGENVQAFGGENASQGSCFKSPIRAQGDKPMIEVPNVAGTLSGGAHSGGLHSDMTIIPCALNPRNFEGKSYVEGNQAIGLNQPSGNNQTLVIANTVTPDAYLARGERKRVNGKAVLTSMHERRIRRLTPIECERLQGFPDGWTQGLSDTQRYKCMGNAVTVNVVEAIGRRMLGVGLFEGGEKK